MGTTTSASLSVEEYLSTVYEPECDYVDGQLEDRNVGEKAHSKLQRKLIRVLPDSVEIFPEVRILSPEDRWSRMTRKLEDYFAMRCPNIWVFDPGQLKAYRYDGTMISEVDGEIGTLDGNIAISLAAIF